MHPNSPSTILWECGHLARKFGVPSHHLKVPTVPFCMFGAEPELYQHRLAFLNNTVGYEIVGDPAAKLVAARPADFLLAVMFSHGGRPHRTPRPFRCLRELP